jgi:hypothetical protein
MPMHKLSSLRFSVGASSRPKRSMPYWMRALKAMPAPTATLHQASGERPISADPSVAQTEAKQARLKSLWPDEFRDGERCAFLRKFKGDRERGG